MADAEKIREQLRTHGDRRREALEQADAELQAVLALAPAAVKAGVSVKQVGELGGVSRPTLYERAPSLKGRS